MKASVSGLLYCTVPTCSGLQTCSYLNDAREFCKKIRRAGSEMIGPSSSTESAISAPVSNGRPVSSLTSEHARVSGGVLGSSPDYPNCIDSPELNSRVDNRPSCADIDNADLSCRKRKMGRWIVPRQDLTLSIIRNSAVK
jgi:hypothetical protein